MLSRLRMSVDQCLDEFQNLIDIVWGPRRTFSIRTAPFYPREKYDYKMLERGLKDMVGRRLPDGNGDAAFRQQNEDACRW